MTTPLIEMKNVQKHFGRHHVLDDISFEIPRQKVIGLVGDNGAGKSTLIKVLTGVHVKDQGQMVFDGKQVHVKTPKQARNLGIETVYQDLALIEGMSIARNFFLGAEPTRGLGPLRWIDQKQMEIKTREALEDIGIHVRATHENVELLSGGERQAVAIGRSIHFGTKLLILDEPTSALSLKETEKVFEYIRRAKQAGMSIILVTHNLHDMLAVCDQFIVLRRGKVLANLEREETNAEHLSALIHGITPPVTGNA